MGCDRSKESLGATRVLSIRVWTDSEASVDLRGGSMDITQRQSA